MASTPTTEPAVLTAGDSYTWQRSLDDYPAGTWTLKYRLINAAGKIDITATASGADHLVTLTPTTTAAYTAGDYTWTKWVEKTGYRITLATGTITVKPNIAALTTLQIAATWWLLVRVLKMDTTLKTLYGDHMDYSLLNNAFRALAPENESWTVRVRSTYLKSLSDSL